MTHVNNVPHIISNGITHRFSENANPKFTPIGDPTLISRRNQFTLNNGRKLGEYIPFYFGLRMPMLYVIHHGLNGVKKLQPGEIIYCVSSVSKVMEAGLDFLFTDGHAVDAFSSQYSKSHLDQLTTILDRSAIKARYWKADNDLDLKRRKEAEFLLLGDLPFEGVLGFIVYDESTKARLLHQGVEEKQIHIKPNAYF